MAVLDDEILQDIADDEKAVAYIREHLPERLQTTFSDAHLHSIIDNLVSLLAQDDSFGEPDEEGYVDVSLSQLAAEIVKGGADDGLASFNPDDVEEVLQLWTDFEPGWE